MTWGEIVIMLGIIRQDRGWSLRQLAAKVGVSPSCVLYWERGEKHPSAAHAIDWAAALGYEIRLHRRAAP